MTAARAGWARWCAADPDLAVVEDLLDLRDWTRQAAKSEKARVLGRLVALARTDQAARAALVWLLLPGAITLADGLRDLTPEVDGLVAGQLWIEVARSHRYPPRGVAKATLNCTRREVLAELGVGCHGEQRDRVWSKTVLLDRFEDRAVLVEEPQPDSYDELVEVLDEAFRDPGTRANIDHIVVTSGGVFVIDAKRHVDKRPELRVEGGILRPRVEKLMVGGRDQTKLVVGVLGQVQRVRAALDDETIEVSGVLCFIDADWPLAGAFFSTRGVRVMSPRRLSKILDEASRDVDVTRVRDRIATAFPTA